MLNFLKIISEPFFIQHLSFSIYNELHAKIILFQSKYQDWIIFFY